MMQEVSHGDKAGKSTSGFSRQLKMLDLYPKLDENFSVQTASGATMTLVGWIITTLLIFAEMRNYYTPRFTEHMLVDTTLGERLQVNVNITFHSITCAEAHLDAMDVAGANQLNIEHVMNKVRIAKDGKPFGKSGAYVIGEGKLDPSDHPPLSTTPDYCGDCFGSETPTLKCCNTCDDLLKAYQVKGWAIDGVLKNSTQCLHERAHQFSDVNPDEGCTITGSMKVNKVAGNFHIAHGDSVVRDGKHIHQFNPATAPGFNVSHTINSMSFGEEYPSMPSDPLDKIVKIIKSDGHTGLFQYFIRIIPTIYSDENGRKIYTNQYTFTDRFRPLILPTNDFKAPVQSETVLPGIFFVYELSPFMIEASRTRIPLLHLLTKLCAIVGGVFTVMGVIDSIVFKLSRKHK